MRWTTKTETKEDEGWDPSKDCNNKNNNKKKKKIWNKNKTVPSKYERDQDGCKNDCLINPLLLLGTYCIKKYHLRGRPETHRAHFFIGKETFDSKVNSTPEATLGGSPYKTILLCEVGDVVTNCWRTCVYQGVSLEHQGNSVIFGSKRTKRKARSAKLHERWAVQGPNAESTPEANVELDWPPTKSRPSKARRSVVSKY